MKIAPAALALALAASLLASPLLAQTTPSGRGGGDLGAGLPTGGPGDRTGSIAATGQTKPPGTALGADPAGDRLEEKSRELDRKIQTGICTGCK